MNAHAARMTTTVLAGICGFLLVLALVQYAGIGRGYRWAPESGDGPRPLAVGTIDRRPFSLPPATTFAETEARPLFNEDRKPTPADAEGDTDAGPPPSPLNVLLTGVIITPDLRVAMVHDNVRNQETALKVGMPLEGDQANWTLIEVKPRSAVFRNAANEKAEVDLQVANMPAPKPGAPNAAQTPLPGNGFLPQQYLSRNAQQAATAQNQANAELAKRIEERRQQMREEAERLRQKNGNPPVPLKQ